MKLGFYSTYVALWTFVAFQGLLIVALLQRLDKLRRLAERGSSLPIGSRAPEFFGVDQLDQQTGLESLYDRAGIILFLSPECPACKALADSLRTLSVELPPTLTICQGQRAACADLSEILGSSVKLIVDESGETARLYGVSGFPRGVVIDRNRRIRGYSYPRTIDELKRSFEESLAESGTEVEMPQVL